MKTLENVAYVYSNGKMYMSNSVSVNIQEKSIDKNFCIYQTCYICKNYREDITIYRCKNSIYYVVKITKKMRI